MQIVRLGGIKVAEVVLKPNFAYPCATGNACQGNPLKEQPVNELLLFIRNELLFAVFHKLTPAGFTEVILLAIMYVAVLFYVGRVASWAIHDLFLILTPHIQLSNIMTISTALHL
jgi:hypothetical protein